MAEDKQKMDVSFFEETTESKGYMDTVDTQADPYFNLLQDVSEACKAGPSHVEGAEAGKWLYTRDNKVMDKFHISVLSFEEVFSEWQQQMGGFAGYHTVPNGLKKAVQQDGFDFLTKEGNILQRTYAYLFYCHDFEDFGFYVARSTALGVCKRWNSERFMRKEALQKQLKSGIIAQPYHFVWEIGSTQATSGRNSYYKPYFKYSTVVNKEKYGRVRAIKQEVDANNYSVLQIPNLEENNVKALPKL